MIGWKLTGVGTGTISTLSSSGSAVVVTGRFVVVFVVVVLLVVVVVVVDGVVGHHVDDCTEEVCHQAVLLVGSVVECVVDCVVDWPGFQLGHVVGSCTPGAIPFSPTVVVTGTIGVTGAGGLRQLPGNGFVV